MIVEPAEMKAMYEADRNMVIGDIARAGIT